MIHTSAAHRSNLLPRRGFTLTEMIVTTALFSLFSTAVVATMSSTLHFWRSSNDRMSAEQNVRQAMQFITLEARQAVVNPHPGSGWQSITPQLSRPTGVLVPNENTPTATSLTFQEANPAFYDPTLTSFNDTDPRNYQRVRFYVVNNALHREVVTYTSTGTAASTTDLTVVAATPPKGLLSLSTQLVGDSYVSIVVSTLEGECQFSLSTSVVALGE